MNPHPNATVAAGGGISAVFIVWLAGHFGISLSAEEGAGAATFIAAVLLAIGKDGIAGIAGKLWHGGVK